MKLDAADLSAIRARADGATEGPWSADGECVRPPREHWDYHRCVASMVGALRAADRRVWRGHKARNAAFIAAARTDVPRLLAHVEALDARIAELEAELDATPNGRDYCRCGDLTDVECERCAP